MKSNTNEDMLQDIVHFVQARPESFDQPPVGSLMTLT